MYASPKSHVLRQGCNCSMQRFSYLRMSDGSHSAQLVPVNGNCADVNYAKYRYTAKPTVGYWMYRLRAPLRTNTVRSTDPRTGCSFHSESILEFFVVTLWQCREQHTHTHAHTHTFLHFMLTGDNKPKTNANPNPKPNHINLNPTHI